MTHLALQVVSAVFTVGVILKPQFLQFQIPCSRGALLLLGMVPARDLSMAEEGRVVEPQGLVLGSTRAFLNAVRAYVVS